MLNVDVN